MVTIYLSRLIPDKIYIETMYFYHFHKLPNLKNPETFNEKMQWLKLHFRDERQICMVDKYLAKEYVAERIGKDHIIPTLGVWDKPEMIDLEQLPDQFVLKCNHDSGSILICREKSKLIKSFLEKSFAKKIKSSGFWYGREWPYKYVKPKIIAEPLINDGTESLIDYKFHCFNGVPRFVLVCKNRFSSGLEEDFYDMNWQHMELKRPNVKNGNIMEKPSTFDKMRNFATILSLGFPFLRVDFYNVYGKVMFGELTFYPASGFQHFIPESYDTLFGSWIDLSKVSGT